MNIPCEVVLKIVNYLDNDVETAKNFRLVCSDISLVYCPGFIYNNIGGSIFRKQYSDIVEYNSGLSIQYLKPFYAMILLAKHINDDYYESYCYYSNNRSFNEILRTFKKKKFNFIFVNSISSMQKNIFKIVLSNDYVETDLSYRGKFANDFNTLYPLGF